MAKKKKSKFQIITMIFVWLMIISTLGGLVLGAVYQLIGN
jgi:cell division septal protein FtsQ